VRSTTATAYAKAPERRLGPGARTGPVRALVAANARFWPTVAPVVNRELGHWTARVPLLVSDPALRRLASRKLEDERFNSEVAATLATLAPHPTRGAAIQAIVALELLFDYLDGRTELPSADPLGEGERLYAQFTSALSPSGPHEGERESEVPGVGRDAADGPYIRALAERARVLSRGLPAFATVAAIASAATRRCAEAQVRLHATSALGDAQLERWAEGHEQAAVLGWREFTGGCASSVLAAHALLAAAADPATDVQAARRIDDAYLAIGGLITMLDSLVDHGSDTARGEPGFIRLFGQPRELGLSIRALTREALARAREAPHADHHEMTLAGVVAYYTSHPGAREAHARGVVRIVRGELSPTIWPSLAVMVGWRSAKRARRLLVTATSRVKPVAGGPHG